MLKYPSDDEINDLTRYFQESETSQNDPEIPDC